MFIIEPPRWYRTNGIFPSFIGGGDIRHWALVLKPGVFIYIRCPYTFTQMQVPI